MKASEITALAREYAEEINPVNLLNDYLEAKMIADMMRNALSEATANQIKDFEGFLRFLLRRYYLVEKSKVEEEYHEAKFTCGNVDPCLETFATSLAQKSVLERLFPLRDVAERTEES